MSDPTSILGLRFLIPLLWALAIGGFSLYCLQIARQITYVTLADGRRAERRLPLAYRILLPLAPNLRVLTHAPAMKTSCEKAGKTLVSAGYEGLLSGEEFIALKFLMPVTVGLLWVLCVAAAARVLPALNRSAWALSLMGLLLTYAHPLLWLRRARNDRHRRIQRSLPFVLDLLTLSVEAGLDFMTALQRNTQRRRIDALNEELIRVIHEIQLGTPRRGALRNMANRVDLPDLRSVVNALIQADEMGVSIGAILRIQSDQIRQHRFERAEKLANEAPIKLLAPLTIFIFPAVFLVLLTPVILQLMRQLF